MDPVEKGFGFYIRCIVRELDRRVNAVLQTSELTQSQADTLHFVIRAALKNRNIRQKDIEQYFHVSNPTVSGVLDRLEQKDLITREKIPEDKRIHYIKPTEKAWELENRICSVLKDTEQEFLSGLDQEEQEAGFHFLKAVTEKIFDSKEGANPCLKR